MSGSPNQALSLFRDLLRQTRQLPSEARSYYRRYIRQTFTNFVEEEDPQRVAQLIERARQDAQWVINKYSKSGPTSHNPRA